MESWVREERENSRIEENEKKPYTREENEGDSARTTEKEMKKGGGKLCNLEGNKGKIAGRESERLFVYGHEKRERRYLCSLRATLVGSGTCLRFCRWTWMLTP